MRTENLDAILDQVRMHFVRVIESEKGQHRATTEVLAEVRAALKVPEHEPIVSYAKKLVAENADLQARLVDGAAAALTVTGRLQAEIDELKERLRRVILEDNESLATGIFETNIKGTAQALSENIARVNLVGGLVHSLREATAAAREMLGHLDKQIQDVLNVDGAHLAQGIEHPGKEVLEAARDLCLSIRGYGDPVLGDERITAARTRLEIALGLREKPKGREVTFDAPLHTGAKTKLD